MRGVLIGIFAGLAGLIVGVGIGIGAGYAAFRGSGGSTSSLESTGISTGAIAPTTTVESEATTTTDRPTDTTSWRTVGRTASAGDSTTAWRTTGFQASTADRTTGEHYTTPPGRTTGQASTTGRTTGFAAEHTTTPPGRTTGPVIFPTTALGRGTTALGTVVPGRTSAPLPLPRIYTLPSKVLCPYSSNISYTIETETNPTPDQADAYMRIRMVMDNAVELYRCFMNVSKTLNVTYDPVNYISAGAWYDGRIVFGRDRYYTTTRVAIHEISHTVGMGTDSRYYAPELNTAVGYNGNGVWLGPEVNKELQFVAARLNAAVSRIETTGPHYYPFGLMYSDEDNWDGILGHFRIMAAFRRDMGL